MRVFITFFLGGVGWEEGVGAWGVGVVVFLGWRVVVVVGGCGLEGERKVVGRKKRGEEGGLDQECGGVG